MKLVHWGSVSPDPSSAITALRFLHPLRISLIRVFHSGSQPFVNSPDLVAETEPDAFYLDIYFNSIPGPNAGAVDKDKRNALVPTSIVYTGGTMDFPMDMGPDHATRLMILKGSFKVMSFALYGEVAFQSTSPPLPYQPTPLPDVIPPPLSKAIDPANSVDPTLLAKTLMSLIPDPPALHIAIRLMCCLKPTDDDWDDPAFPNHGTDLEMPEDFDLTAACDLASRPVTSTSEGKLSAFAERVSGLIGAKTLTQSDEIAKLFSVSASQIPSLILALCQYIDPEDVFDAVSLDDGVIVYLLDAAANADFARHCSSDAFTATLTQCIENPTSDKPTKFAARRLLDRIDTWISFEKALSSSEADFPKLIAQITDFGTDEKSLGIWLESMVFHDDFIESLSKHPTSEPGRALCRLENVRDQAEFVAYIRAFIGVASIFVVWAWADSVGDDECRTRSLSIIRIWQTVDGYREIVNQLLLLRQFSRRLKWIVQRDYDDDPPRKSSYIGEQIISELGKEPHAMFHGDFRDNVFSLTLPLSFISEAERTRLRKSAFVADEGLESALEELFFKSEHPTLSLRRLYVLRVSLAIVAREASDDEESELRAVRTTWEKHSMGLPVQLTILFGEVARDLNQCFSVSEPTPPVIDNTLVELLLLTGTDIIKLHLALSVNFPLAPSAIRDLVGTVVDFFTVCESATQFLPSSHGVRMAASSASASCLDLIHQVSLTSVESSTNTSAPQTVLQTLFHCSTEYKRFDPILRTKQILRLIEHVLPAESTADWVISILPPLLAPMKAFFRLLDAPSRLSFIQKLISLDDGVVGIAEWLLIAECKALLQSLTNIRLSTSVDSPHMLIKTSTANISIAFLSQLAHSELDWLMNTIASVPDFHTVLKDVFTSMLDGWFVSDDFWEFAGQLARGSRDGDLRDLTSSVALAYLRGQPKAWDKDLMLHLLDKAALTDAVAVRQEISHCLAAVANNDMDSNPDVEDIITTAMGWLHAQEHSAYRYLYGITTAQLLKFQDLAPAHDSGPCTCFTADEDEVILPLQIDLDVAVQVALKDVPSLFRPEITTSLPSTPKGTVTPDVLGLVVSPPSALLHSPMASTLTKTYTQNDFRELRQSASRQNTSRMPSMHVDVGIHGPLT